MATKLLLSFPPADLSEAEYDQKIRAFSAAVKKLSPSALTVSDAGDSGKHLNILDPARHSLAYVHVLLAHYHIVKKSGKLSKSCPFYPGGESWARVLRFFEVFDPIQVRYAGREFAKLAEVTFLLADSISRPILAVQPLRSALLRLDPTSSTLTATHTYFVHACLKANACRAALSVLAKPIYHIPTPVDKIYHQRAQIPPCTKDQSSVTYITHHSGLTGTITHRTYLEYYLYGAMIYMIRKEWGDALRFLRIVISAPITNTVSKIMVEGYKKFLLVQLLAEGQVSYLPQDMHHFAIKAYRSLGRPYEILAELFQDSTLERLKAEISVGDSFWREDNNYGLVHQLPAAYRRFQILRLVRVFAALSIPDIAARLSIEDISTAQLEELIASLIETGQLDGKLVQATDPSKPTTLRFGKTNTTTDQNSEARLLAELVEEKGRLKWLLENAASLDVRLELGQHYIDGLARYQRKPEAQAALSRSMIEEEDLMGTS